MHHDDKRLLELLERWQSGTFSRADELELQQLVASDEFRREAVEGYWNSPDAEHAVHLSRLRQGLRRRSGMSKRVTMPQVMLAAAAVALLVLVTVWLIPTRQKAVEMAQKETPVASPPIASNLPEKSDTESPARSTTPKQSTPAPPSASGGSPPVAKPSGPPATTAPAGTTAIPPPAPQAAAEEALAVQAERKEAETANTADQLDDVDTGAGNMAVPAKAARDKAARQYEEGKSEKKRSKSSSPAQPLGGWDDFQDFLRKNARLTPEARQNNVSGFVRIQFQLDAKNQPLDFKILRSLGYGCDEEAIRLIKAYDWQRGDDNTLTVDVQFVR